jgi:hypothetical protein
VATVYRLIFLKVQLFGLLLPADLDEAPPAGDRLEVVAVC